LTARKTPLVFKDRIPSPGSDAGPELVVVFEVGEGPFVVDEPPLVITNPKFSFKFQKEDEFQA